MSQAGSRTQAGLNEIVTLDGFINSPCSTFGRQTLDLTICDKSHIIEVSSAHYSMSSCGSVNPIDRLHNSQQQKDISRKIELQIHRHVMAD